MAANRSRNFLKKPNSACKVTGGLPLNLSGNDFASDIRFL